MIILDTGLLAEAVKPQPDSTILKWLDEQKAETLFITTISLAELLASIGKLPDGRAKDGLAAAVDRLLQLFSGRVLPFDTIAAWSYADLATQAAKRAKAPSMADISLAAIAAAHGLPIASMNPAVFENLGVLTIDPRVVD